MTLQCYLDIFINRIQPFEAANISAAFFLCRPMRKHNRCHKFQNKFQDDISCTLAMYSYIWDSLLYIMKKSGKEDKNHSLVF